MTRSAVWHGSVWLWRRPQPVLAPHARLPYNRYYHHERHPFTVLLVHENSAAISSRRGAAPRHATPRRCRLRSQQKRNSSRASFPVMAFFSRHQPSLSRASFVYVCVCVCSIFTSAGLVTRFVGIDRPFHRKYIYPSNRGIDRIFENLLPERGSRGLRVPPYAYGTNLLDKNGTGLQRGEKRKKKNDERRKNGSAGRVNRSR